MIRIVFPYILFMSLVSLSGGILNVYRQFAIPAFTPVLLNLSVIGAALFLAPYCDPPVKALAWGVFIGGAAQLALQIRPLWKIGMLPRPRVDWRDPGVRRVLTNMGPAVLGVSAAQISALINTQLAAWLGDGRISWITYADRLMEFPSALLGVALGTVLLPSLAKHHADANPVEYSSLLDWGLRLAFLLGIAGGGRAVHPGAAARYHDVPIRQVHSQRRAANPRRAAGLQRGPPRAHSGQDPRAGLLRSADHEDAGEDRFSHGARCADTRRHSHVSDRARGSHAVDFPRRVP
jgi:hypothetical protein